MVQTLTWLVGNREFLTDASQSQDTFEDHQAVFNMLEHRREEQERQQWERDRAEAGPSGAQENDRVEAGPSGAQENDRVEAGPSGAQENDRVEAGPSGAQENDRAEATPSSAQPNVQPEPYFPVGLALSEREPTKFNFGLYLFDCLRLPRGLFDGDCDGPLRFDDVVACNTYCIHFAAEQQLKVQASRQPDSNRQDGTRAVPDKAVMFRRSGKPLGPKLKTDNPLFDRNLEQLRLDNFGNVMALFAHPWSDISVQLTHGFPKRLVSQSHGGMLPGNLTAAARVSNQALRSLAPGDVAAFISRDMVQGLGLTTAELILARSSALKYAGKRDKPARLVGLMFRYGIDFLHLTALTVEQMQTLTDTTTQHWNNIFRSTTDPDASVTDSSSSSSDSEDDSHQLTVSWTVPGAECGDDLPPPDHERREQRVCHHVHSLMFSYLQTITETEDEPQPAAAAETQPTAARNGSSGQRKRKRKTDGPMVEDDSEDEDATAAPAETTPAPPDARQRLLLLPQVCATRIPGRDSIQKMLEFFQHNMALPPMVSELS